MAKCEQRHCNLRGLLGGERTRRLSSSEHVLCSKEGRAHQDLHESDADDQSIKWHAGSMAVGAQAELELACTQLYCEDVAAFESFADGLPSTQAYGLGDSQDQAEGEAQSPRKKSDENTTTASTTPFLSGSHSQPMAAHHGRHVDEYACTQVYNGESDDEDITAELLQSGRQEQQTEPRDATPVPNLPSGGSVQQHATSEGNGESRGLAACRADVSLAAPSAVSDELACTLQYEIRDGIEEVGPPSDAEAPAANPVTTSCAEMRHPRLCNDLACTQAYNGESDDEDITAELLQSGRQEQQTEPRDATPVPNLPSGGSVQQHATSEGNGESGGLAACRADVSLAAPSAVSDELACTLQYEIRDGIEEVGPPSDAEAPAANPVTTSCAEMRHPRLCNDLACTQAYNGESDDEDITAELLQSGRQEHQVEHRDATPVPNLPSGGSVQQHAMSEGNGESGGLAACRADVSLAAPSAVSDELACTLQYEIRDGIEEVEPPSNAEALAANPVTTSCGEMRPPRLCNDLACTQAYNGESDDEDITAELLQSGRQEQQTELRDATPVPNLPSGGSVQQHAMSEGNGESGGLAACRADVSLAAPSAVSDELACTLQYEIRDGIEEVGPPSNAEAPAANPVTTSCAEMRPPRLCNDLACTQAYNGESDDEDITAELLQSSRQEQQTELRDATPVPNLPSGASVQQPAMSEGNADSGGLAACMADVSLAAPSAVSDELACTLQYEIRDGIEEVGPPSNAEAPAANPVTTSCAEMRPPRLCNDLACTQAYNGESDDEDITAELLQSGRQEQQTELRDATPVPNLPSGASVQQPAMSEGNADSGGLAACMADVSLAAPSAVSDELACTLQYEIRDGIEEVGPPSNAEAPAANRVTTSCAEMRPPRLCNDLACTQAYNGESDDEDITAELLQPGRQGQQTELRDATPVPNLPSGGSVQKRAMSECNGDSGGLAACRADVSAAAKSAISIESACTLHREINEGGFGVGSGHQPPHDVAHAQPLERGCTGVRIERKSVASDCHGEPHHRAPNSSSRYRPRMVSVMVQTGEDDTKEEPRKARPANKPEPPRLSLLIPKRPRDETVEPVDVDAYSAACHALWGGRTPQKVAAPSLRDFLAAKQEEVEENCEPPPGTLALVGLSPRSELSPFDVHGNQADVKKEALSAKRVPKTSLPSPPERSEPRLSEPLPKRSQTQRLGPGGQGQSSEIPERFVKQSTRRSLDFGSLSPKHGDHTVPVPAWLQQIHAVKRGRPTEPECVKGLQAEILPTPCRRGRLNSRCQPSPDLSESESESPATMPPASPPPQQAPIGAPAPASVSTAKEGSPSASAASTAPATPTASPSPRARVVTEQSDAQASQCSEALEPLAAPVETMEVSAPSPGETPENTATAEEASARLSSTECRDDADDADDADGVGTGRSQFCFAKTTQEEERARREANGATGSPQSPSQNVAYASAPAPVDLSQFAFVATATATVHQTAKTTVPEDSAAPKLAPPPCGACAEAEPPTLSGSSSLSVPGARSLRFFLARKLPQSVFEDPRELEPRASERGLA